MLERASGLRPPSPSASAASQTATVSGEAGRACSCRSAHQAANGCQARAYVSWVRLACAARAKPRAASTSSASRAKLAFPASASCRTIAF
jgi:hypothetical protein